MTNKIVEWLPTQGSRLYLQQYMVNAEDKLSEMIIAKHHHHY